MNKPSWDDAPDWARWLARDASGDWYWYEFEPGWEDRSYRPEKGEYLIAGYDSYMPPGPIERRPE
jgi:hypothetical protein